jgi:phosphatidate cytidylyltransferase
MLRQRLLAAGVLIPGFLAALFYLPHWAWALLMGAVTVGAAWEWARLSGYSRTNCVFYAILVAGLLAFLYGGENEWILKLFWLAVLVFWLAIAPLWLIRHGVIRHPLILALTGLIVLLPTWLALVMLRDISASVVLFLMGLVWVADSAAYFSGRRWGKHQLAPRVSPGKTWEGVAGAVLAAVLYVALWRWLAPQALAQFSAIPIIWLMLAAGLLVAISIVGDLFESHMKRCAGMKDSSHLIPGHGGILDRIDSQTSVLPVALALMVFAGLGA